MRDFKPDDYGIVLCKIANYRKYWLMEDDYTQCKYLKTEGYIHMYVFKPILTLLCACIGNKRLEA